MDNPQRIAIIDLGSNTGRVILMRTVPGYAFHLEDEIRELVRLREGFSPETGLTPAAFERGLSTLRVFKQFCNATDADRIIATATSAVRDARNGAEFVRRVRGETGIELRILSGEQEATYSFIGALNEIPARSGFVVDIGGGSAQITRFTDRQSQERVSFTLGALALTERFITSDPPTDDEVQAVQTEIDRQLDSTPWVTTASEEDILIGLGGTIRTMAKIQAKVEDYPLDTLHGFILTRRSLAKSIKAFCRLSLTKRQNISGLSDDRADIILPGAMVIATIMDRLGKEAVHISEGGVREGLFFEAFWHEIPGSIVNDVREFGVLNMARTYGYRQPHADHVRFLSSQLFDQLQPLHGYGQAERQLLEAAALLHDIGTVVNYDDHHKHSKMLIENNGLRGYTPRETALIALLTRYHRKGSPDFHAHGSLMQPDDQQRLMTLAALLRLAEHLERGRTQVVEDLTATWSDDALTIELAAQINPAVELWTARRYAAPLLADALEKSVSLAYKLSGEENSK